MQLTFPLFLGISSLYSVSEDSVGRFLTYAVWMVALLKGRVGGCMMKESAVKVNLCLLVGRICLAAQSDNFRL